MSDTHTARSPQETLLALVDRALGFAEGISDKRVDQLRRQFPHDSPFRLIERLDKQFSRTVTATGAGTGALAAAPGIGLGLAVGAAGGDLLAFLTAAAAHALAVAKVHGVVVSGIEHRRALLLGVLLGNAGAKVVTNTAGRAGAHWGRLLAGTLPLRVVREINKHLGGMLLRRFGPRAGIVAVAKAAPLGLGAVLGGGGNFLMARDLILSTRRAFGDPPVGWPATS